MQNTPSHHFRKRAFLFFIALALSGCSLFVSHYDAAAYQNFTSLKAYHLKFLDDYSTVGGHKWNDASVKATCDLGELKFREAHEYALGKKDDTRVRAIEYLHNAFTRQCKDSLQNQALFNAKYVDQERATTSQNYDWAIEGELTRVNAPKK